MRLSNNIVYIFKYSYQIEPSEEDVENKKPPPINNSQSGPPPIPNRDHDEDNKSKEDDKLIQETVTDGSN